MASLSASSSTSPLLPPPEPPDLAPAPALWSSDPPLKPPNPPDPPDPVASPSVLFLPSNIAAIPLPQVCFQNLDLGDFLLDPTSAFSAGMASLPRGAVKPSHRLTIPLHLWMFLEASVTAPMSDGGSSVVTLITLHLWLSQVCYSSSPAFPSVVCYRNLEECFALVLWMPSVPPDLKTSVSRIPNLLPIDGSFNAFVRFITAVCRVVSVFFITGYTSCSFSMWQIRKNCLGCIPPVNLDLDFHSPHRSVKELILLPSTSLVLSVIVAGSIVLKAVLFRAVNKRLLMSQSLEAFIPPLGFLDQDHIWFFGLNSTSVELACSHLSLYLYLSYCIVLCLTLSSTNLWFDALVCLAPSSLLYLLLLEINS
ncbi:unnamed protein product [Microthlaspi erraticum]|uniref:Uncharacterized protein n=1 Tax=Microthlaspi erraticum TaxID=1685480 RepID=A0A6D2J8E5_9BRAS|nr:unnamed protein product [Microthlaspi erraticum]